MGPLELVRPLLAKELRNNLHVFLALVMVANALQRGSKPQRNTTQRKKERNNQIRIVTPMSKRRKERERKLAKAKSRVAAADGEEAQL